MYKARLVAKVYVQKQGVNFDEVFAPTAQMETICIIVVLVAKKRWLIHNLDIKLAFLYGNLVEEIYITQPGGFVKKNKTKQVYKFAKAFYRLRQAP